MRSMGLDVGDRRIGVSVSDELGWTAQGIEVIQRNADVPDQDIQRIEELVKQYSIVKIVVGLPKNMNGSIGPRGELCKEFARQLEERTSLPVIMWDERLSTVAAEKFLISADVNRKKRKTVIDKMAANLILQGYLDSQK
ncbi:Holliday junction resolvase RuvX [Caldalkalibacillus mannanilyticus]|uniref:Holliday junction resolvase RuvX n=1 Tax=Caldalkalibacillus mannanilyticus TaxID=1418 RepID=UPI000468D7C2|nr:Holliday junction resolvase RuvX [Caldalkalibacillus mannanilyticus]